MKYPQADYTLWKFVRTNEVGWTAWFTAVVLFYFIAGRFAGFGWWPVDVFLGLLTGAVWLRAYLLREKLRKLNANPGNPHYDDVCEGCNPPCFTNGKPLFPIEYWWAATRNVTRESASQTFGYLRIHGGGERIEDEYAKYLQHPKFK